MTDTGICVLAAWFVGIGGAVAIRALIDWIGRRLWQR